eukprot:CAMPEP_0117674364 /NCGR_PEP_ID=MMETSP0804-20121206/14995_1 /TAXON_ID=1074897 /ORGANISM="Tetraselmis astigmatica, Strain CCMP880" /LENGTH=122 /DNA_ID=CAMNT_0005483221 /DNA_START=50 /DNA_END=418 /DNA_ORIENTATION=-
MNNVRHCVAVATAVLCAGLLAHVAVHAPWGSTHAAFHMECGTLSEYQSRDSTHASITEGSSRIRGADILGFSDYRREPQPNPVKLGQTSFGLTSGTISDGSMTTKPGAIRSARPRLGTIGTR